MTGSRYFQPHGELAGPLPSSDPLFKKLDILKINDIYKFNVAKFIYLNLLQETPNIFSNWFKPTRTLHNYATTSSSIVLRENLFDPGTVYQTNNLQVKGYNLTKYGGKQLKVFGVKLWNSLPNYLREARSVKIFQNQLKKHFLQSYND